MRGHWALIHLFLISAQSPDENADTLCAGKDVRVVYEYLVETCMGILKDDLQLPFNVLERLEHPELHERSFPNFILFRHTYDRF